MNPHDHTEDAEFDDFLKGEGDLARQLRDLPQPQPPKALSAAILARAASDLGAAAVPGASANDAVLDGVPAAPPARHYLRRARVPLGLAASVVLALFMVRGLMPQAFAPVAEREVVSREAAAPDARVAAASPAAEAPSATVPAPPPPPAPKLAQVKRSVARPTAKPAPVADIVIAGSAIDATPASEQKVLGYSAAPSVMMRSAPAVEVLSAPAWLARMSDMLKAGRTKEAQAEWLKFRMRYPDAEVPLELRLQLDAIN
ncbi:MULTISPECIES: hypothetical protein [unclassified Duganella]|uniref:hypothetical protein n=1 Tax=unclassified Duganella TaxID=2636909 RepID=UPI000E35574A|nr:MULTISPECIES: hypothetical protein [unclassified Duganella]RFP08125.1 hypothetical protein D0T23_30305 [Duganella sp. BJB475]RFP36194.1 hypothetical protein D0T21_07105 [Duganella sp. BJB476]